MPQRFAPSTDPSAVLDIVEWLVSDECHDILIAFGATIANRGSM